MRSEIRTRVATADDAVELARLNENFNGVIAPAEQYARRMDDPRRVETPILAEVDGHIVGLAALRVVPCLFYDHPHAELTELYVDPTYRRRGVARALMAHAVHLAREQGARTLLVLTDLRNDAAQALYRSQGFEDQDLAMQKDLS